MNSSATPCAVPKSRPQPFRKNDQTRNGSTKKERVVFIMNLLSGRVHRATRWLQLLPDSWKLDQKGDGLPLSGATIFLRRGSARIARVLLCPARQPHRRHGTTAHSGVQPRRPPVR